MVLLNFLFELGWSVRGSELSLEGRVRSQDFGTVFTATLLQRLAAFDLDIHHCHPCTEVIRIIGWSWVWRFNVKGFLYLGYTRRHQVIHKHVIVYFRFQRCCLWNSEVISPLKNFLLLLLLNLFGAFKTFGRGNAYFIAALFLYFGFDLGRLLLLLVITAALFWYWFIHLSPHDLVPILVVLMIVLVFVMVLFDDDKRSWLVTLLFLVLS